MTTIKAETIADFLSAKGVKHECNLCRAKDWVVQEASQNNSFVISTVAQTSAFPVAILVCGNCANTLFFSSKAIEQWNQGRE